MKRIKTKLSAAIVMVVISAMMLTGVSFAWYTLSTNPEVTNIKATAVANENLEIALDNFYGNGAAIDTASSKTATGNMQGSTTGNDYTWGNMVDVTHQMSMAEGASRFPFELRPAKFVNTANSEKFATYEYGADGRVFKEKDLTIAAGYGPAGTLTDEDTATARANQVNGVAPLYAEWGTTEAPNNTNYAFKVVYWLRTNEPGSISLSKTGVARADGANTAGLATGGGSVLTVTNKQVDGAAATAAKSVFEAQDFGVVFKITPDKSGATASWVEATVDTDGKLSATLFTAEKDIAYKVEMFVYLRGDKVTNSEAAADCDIAINVQFDNAAINAGGAMKY